MEPVLPPTMRSVWLIVLEKLSLAATRVRCTTKNKQTDKAMDNTVKQKGSLRFHTDCKVSLISNMVTTLIDLRKKHGTAKMFSQRGIVAYKNHRRILLGCGFDEGLNKSIPMIHI